MAGLSGIRHMKRSLVDAALESFDGSDQKRRQAVVDPAPMAPMGKCQQFCMHTIFQPNSHPHTWPTCGEPCCLEMDHVARNMNHCCETCHPFVCAPTLGSGRTRLTGRTVPTRVKAPPPGTPPPSASRPES